MLVGNLDREVDASEIVPVEAATVVGKYKQAPSGPDVPRARGSDRERPSRIIAGRLLTVGDDSPHQPEVTAVIRRSRA
jgi:hypothetical protein